VTKSNLARTIGKFGVAALAINGLIGAGIFALPAGAYAYTGNLSPWVFLLCALLMSVIIICFAQLSMGFTQTGGPVAYTQKAFGDHAAFQTTWLLYVGRVTALAANTNALVLYISVIFPSVTQGVGHYFSITFILLLLLWLNLHRTNQTISVINSVTILKLFPLLIFVIIGLGYLDSAKIMDFNVEQVTDLNTALLLLVYAYIGFEGAVVPAGESENPKKSIAKALIGTLVFTALLYFLMQSITISVLSDASSTKTPIADGAFVMLGQPGLMMISIAAIFSIFGNLSTVVFTAPRMTYALAEQGNLPKWFAQLSNNTSVPASSIIFLVIVALVLALTGSFIWLAIVSSLARLIGYFLTMAALIKLRPELVKNKHWKLPAGILIPILALFICVWLGSAASWQAWLATAAFSFIGGYLFYKAKYRRASL